MDEKKWKQVHHRELETAMTLAKELPPEQLPGLFADLEEIRTTAMPRLMAPASMTQEDDDSVKAPEAAAMLGISLGTLYKVWKKRYAHLRRHDVGKLVFSKSAIRTHIQHNIG